MFKVISKEETQSLASKPKVEFSTKGMTDQLRNQLRNQFKSMSFGESFIYPVSLEKHKRTVSSRLKGTCNSLGFIIRTRTVDDGILVIFEGYK